MFFDVSIFKQQKQGQINNLNCFENKTEKTKNAFLWGKKKRNQCLVV
jgi:hypothetical protein